MFISPEPELFYQLNKNQIIFLHEKSVIFIKILPKFLVENSRVRLLYFFHLLGQDIFFLSNFGTRI